MSLNVVVVEVLKGFIQWLDRSVKLHFVTL